MAVRVGDVPVEPPPTSWTFPDVTDSADDLVAVGADLKPATVLAAYRRGLFPMPVAEIGEMAWWSPVRRAVIPVDGLAVSRSMRRSANRFSVTVNTDFAGVLDGCADPRRPGAWIDDQIRGAYTHLHELGWVHSIEVWQDGELAGGLYGVAIGGLFAGESMFHRVTDASKVALMATTGLLDDGRPARLFDVQWLTPHLQSLGAVEIGRAGYLDRLQQALSLPLPPCWR